MIPTKSTTPLLNATERCDMMEVKVLSQATARAFHARLWISQSHLLSSLIEPLYFAANLGESRTNLFNNISG